MKSYKFYKDGQEFSTDNLAAFCKEHGLQRRHMHEVIFGSRKSYKGFTKTADQHAPINGGDGSMTVAQILSVAELAARASGDLAYQQLVQGRVDKIRRGEKLEVKVSEDFFREHEELRALVENVPG